MEDEIQSIVGVENVTTDDIQYKVTVVSEYRTFDSRLFDYMRDNGYVMDEVTMVGEQLQAVFRKE